MACGKKGQQKQQQQYVSIREQNPPPQQQEEAGVNSSDKDNKSRGGNRGGEGEKRISASPPPDRSCSCCCSSGTTQRDNGDGSEAACLFDLCSRLASVCCLFACPFPPFRPAIYTQPTALLWVSFNYYLEQQADLLLNQKQGGITIPVLITTACINL